VDNTKELKHISLCTGYAGIDLGLKQVIGNVRTIAYVEIETFPICNLVAKMENGLIDPAPLWTNLKTFPWELFNKKVDILSGGFPCQPFSAAGRRKGDEDPRHLWPYITKGIQQLGKPAIVFLENVKGILSSKLKGDQWTDSENTPILLHVLRELERLGYKATAGIFSACEVGAPHQRKRVFILGIRNELSEESSDRVSRLIESNRTESRTAWPAFRNQKQYWYEPSRVTMDYTNSERVEGSFLKKETGKHKQKKESLLSRPSTWRNLQGKVEPKMGRNADGDTSRVDYAKLFKSCDNRTDELRLLGNGVVPNTTARAFRTLWEELVNMDDTRSK
jgi:DNA (cytosine-5)-methyltransferase 1